MAQVRVGNVNFWGWFADWQQRGEQLIAEVSRLRLDVLLMQEVRVNGEHDQAHWLAERGGFRHLAYHPVHEDGQGKEGLSILSVHPLDNIRQEYLPVSRSRRGRLRAELLLPEGKRLHLDCVHLDFQPAAARHCQLAYCVETDFEGGQVLGGDFNSPPNDLLPVAARLGWELACHDRRPSWPVNPEQFALLWQHETGRCPAFDMSPKRLDYLLGREVSILDYGQVDRGDISDHALLWAEFAVR